MGLFSKNDKWKITKNIQMVVLKEFLRTVQKKKLEQQKRVVYDFLDLMKLRVVYGNLKNNIKKSIKSFGNKNYILFLRKWF